MSEIDLRRIDLNLLLVLDVLMAERSVTRAAQRLGRTQSAVSHSLARLREQLGDPLLVKTNQGMRASAFAERLSAQVRPVLADIRRVLAPQHSFEPALSERVFRLAVPDFATGFFPELLQRVLSIAPRVALEWATPNESTQAQLLEGQLDLALIPAKVRRADGVDCTDASALQWACFARHDHPAWKRWNAQAWTAWPHVMVRISDGLSSPVAQATGAMGLRRRVGAWVPNFSTVAPLLAHSDLIATLPALTVMNAMKTHQLACRAAPFALDPMTHVLAWSTRHGADPAVVWLREQVTAVWQTQVAQAEALVGSLKR
jgi:DNA-binding transcriptional LysR family regulator